MKQLTFTAREKESLRENYRKLWSLCADLEKSINLRRLKSLISGAVEGGHCVRDKHGIHPVVHDLATAVRRLARLSR